VEERGRLAEVRQALAGEWILSRRLATGGVHLGKCPRADQLPVRVLDTSSLDIPAIMRKFDLWASGVGRMKKSHISRVSPVSRTLEPLVPLPAGPPWMVQPGYPVPSYPVYPLPESPAPSPTVLYDRRSAFALVRNALGGVVDSFHRLFGL